ncbi:MAG: hypothetical protein ACE5PO_08725 [Candidatus Bathyarchaeia archaeon]
MNPPRRYLANFTVRVGDAEFLQYCAIDAQNRREARKVLHRYLKGFYGEEEFSGFEGRGVYTYLNGTIFASNASLDQVKEDFMDLWRRFHPETLESVEEGW